MVNIKGPMILNRLKYIDEHGTAGQKELILDKLDPEYQSIVRGSVLPITWFPFDLFLQLSDAIVAVIGKGDGQTYSDMGRYSASLGARGFYRIFFKLGSPEFIIKKSPALWNQLMDRGECYSDVPQKRVATLGIRNLGMFPPRGFCLGLQGWTVGLLENSGARDITVEYSKRPSANDHDMEFTVTWS